MGKQMHYRKISGTTRLIIASISASNYCLTIELTARGVWKNIKAGILGFVHEFNAKYTGDFVVMNNAEVDRFRKVAQFLADKDDRRFKTRPLTKNDFGYLIEHLFGMSGADYDDFN